MVKKFGIIIKLIEVGGETLKEDIRIINDRTNAWALMTSLEIDLQNNKLDDPDKEIVR